MGYEICDAAGNLAGELSVRFHVDVAEVRPTEVKREMAQKSHNSSKFHITHSMLVTCKLLRNCTVGVIGSAYKVQYKIRRSW